VPLLNISFEHRLTASALERQTLRQEFRGRLLLRLTAPELVTLFALRTMEGNRQRCVVNRHAGLYSERHASAIVFDGQRWLTKWLTIQSEQIGFDSERIRLNPW